MDLELVEHIKGSFQETPSSRLKEIVRAPEVSEWSAEAREAARQLLAERAIGKAPTPPEEEISAEEEVDFPTFNQARPPFLKAFKAIHIFLFILSVLILPLWGFFAYHLQQKEKSFQGLLQKERQHRDAGEFEKSNQLFFFALAEGRDRDEVQLHVEIAFRLCVIFWALTIILLIVRFVLEKTFREPPLGPEDLEPWAEN